jgi:hypothetical protein
VGLVSKLRQRWQRHDEKLLEEALEDRDHPQPERPHLPLTSVNALQYQHQLQTDRQIADAVESENALEHEGPE